MNYNRNSLKKSLRNLKVQTDEATELTKKITLRKQNEATELIKKTAQCKQNEGANRDIQVASGINGITYILDQLMPSEVTKRLHRAAQHNQAASLGIFVLPFFHSSQSPPNPWHNALVNNCIKMGISFGTDYAFEQEPIKTIINKQIPPKHQELSKNIITVTVIGLGMLLLEKVKNQ